MRELLTQPLMPYTDPLPHPPVPLPKILQTQLEAAEKLAASSDPDAQAQRAAHLRVVEHVAGAIERNRQEREAWKTPRTTEMP